MINSTNICFLQTLWDLSITVVVNLIRVCSWLVLPYSLRLVYAIVFCCFFIIIINVSNVSMSLSYENLSLSTRFPKHSFRVFLVNGSIKVVSCHWSASESTSCEKTKPYGNECIYCMTEHSTVKASKGTSLALVGRTISREFLLTHQN